MTWMTFNEKKKIEKKKCFCFTYKMITRSQVKKHSLRNSKRIFYDKNRRYNDCCEKTILFYEIEKQFHKRLQESLKTVKGKEYYQKDKYKYIVSKAKTFFSRKDHYKFHMKKNASLEELCKYISENLKNKKNYYIVETKAYTKFGKSEMSNMIQNLYRYESDSIQSISFIFKK